MNIKRITAKEGLIFLGLGVLLYLILLIMPDIPCQFPKYKLEFENGKSYIVIISPELSQDCDKKNFIKESLNPPPQLVSKRIKEFIKDNGISLRLKAANQINSTEVNVSKFFLSFFSLNFIVKIIIVYSFLLVFRFIIWAIKALKEK